MAIRKMKAGVIAVIALLIGVASVVPQAGDRVPYPREYRKFRHVKTTVVGPQSPKFQGSGGMHHYYANEIALEGYRTGRFPDGSVLVDDLLEVKEVDGVTVEGPRRRVAVMRKQAEQYPQTGGWGFEIFKGDGDEGSLTPQEKAACFACHRKGRDSVHAEFQK